MLRVILATLGVALIAFGLFGGKSLEQVYAGLNGAFGNFGADDSSSVEVAGSTSVDSGSETQSESDTQSETVVAVSSIDSDSVKVASDTSVAGEQSSNTAPQAADTGTATEVGSDERKLSIANVQQDDDGTALVTQASLDNSSEDSALEDRASEDSTSEDIGALKEVKASARNEELELALVTTDSEQSDMPKEADVGEILQTTTGGNNTEALFVLKDLVNMRQGPSIEHPVVLRLEKGQELMEFKRDGKWVHVGAYGTSGKIGWVHERLVGKTPG